MFDAEEPDACGGPVGDVTEEVEALVHFGFADASYENGVGAAVAA